MSDDSGIKFNSKYDAEHFVSSKEYKNLKKKDLKDVSTEDLYLLAACAKGISYEYFEQKIESVDTNDNSGSSGQIGDNRVDWSQVPRITETKKEFVRKPNDDRYNEIVELIATRLTYVGEPESITVAENANFDKTDIDKSVEQVINNRIVSEQTNVAAYKQEYAEKLDAARKQGDSTVELEKKFAVVQGLSDIIEEQADSIEAKKEKLRLYTECFFANVPLLSKNRDSTWLTIGKVIGLGLLTIFTLGGYAAYAGIQKLRAKPVVGWSSDGKKFVSHTQDNLGQLGESTWKSSQQFFNDELAKAKDDRNSFQLLKDLRVKCVKELGGLVEEYQDGNVTLGVFKVRGSMIQSKIAQIDEARADNLKIYNAALVENQIHPMGITDAHNSILPFERIQSSMFEDWLENKDSTRKLGNIALKFLNKETNETQFSKEIGDVKNQTDVTSPNDTNAPEPISGHKP